MGDLLEMKQKRGLEDFFLGMTGGTCLCVCVPACVLILRLRDLEQTTSPCIVYVHGLALAPLDFLLSAGVQPPRPSA